MLRICIQNAFDLNILLTLYSVTLSVDYCDEYFVHTMFDVWGFAVLIEWKLFLGNKMIKFRGLEFNIQNRCVWLYI